ncbi:hypothetical protein UFOVP1204_74 [uncultured Caudovirales phage]|uniref:Uncharacterized protein n=1 Tax=uncultured Caudovirales phage TaxID=2100421 RepID=A0A6J5RAD3_9CAUD|nr:hypothetical protein UFOVP473_27 [uncultured Caudovirales phage]CAB4176460.1 hypothetical protein UFOVP983_27 [uncultured Caudovirales phage]CAB4190481.1 hypothetical protein UFOVP1204_74 [uncultured Caudovirales phage]
MSNAQKSENFAMLNAACKALELAVAMRDSYRAEWIKREFHRNGIKVWVVNGKAIWEDVGEAAEPVVHVPQFRQFRL